MPTNPVIEPRSWHLHSVGNSSGATVAVTSHAVVLEVLDEHRFKVSDPINVASGRYESIGNGKFRLFEVGITLVGYAGRDIELLLIMSALASLSSDTGGIASVHDSRLVVETVTSILTFLKRADELR